MVCPNVVLMFDVYPNVLYLSYKTYQNVLWPVTSRFSICSKSTNVTRISVTGKHYFKTIHKFGLMNSISQYLPTLLDDEFLVKIVMLILMVLLTAL